MRKVSRVVIGFFALFTISPGSFGGESLSPSTMLGTWELVEWVHEGQKLKPPQVQARISIQNGVSMFIAHRETEDGWVAIYGYGPYLLDGVSFSYGYDFQTEVVKEGQAVSLSQTSIPVAKLLGHHEGGRYKLVGEGDWGFILESDSMTYFQDGKILRSYRRVRE